MTITQWVGLAVLGVLVVYLVGYVFAKGISDAFYARKARYNRDIISEMERSSRDGNEE